MLEAGTRLHVRIYKPEKPKVYGFTAYERVPWFARLSSRSERQHGGTGVETTLRPVRRHGKTVAWDAFFRVKKPGRHYYLQSGGRWKRVPHTHASYREGTWTCHVKTEASHW